jgi:hypothetical protein
MDETRTAGYRAVTKQLREPSAEDRIQLNLNWYTSLFRLPPEIGNLKRLRALTCEGSPIEDLSPIAGLVELEELNLNGTEVADLSPLSGMQKMQDAAVRNWQAGVKDTGLSYAKTPISQVRPYNLFVRLDQPARTVETINEVRRQQGLSTYIPNGYEPPKDFAITFLNKDAVNEWLNRQPDDVAVVFAGRAALRAIPTIAFSNWPGTRRKTTRDTVLRVFRAIATAWAVAAYPSDRRELNAAARAALSGLGDVKAPSPIRAAAYASATATGEAGAVSRASTVIGYALDAAGSKGSEAYELFLEALATDASLLDQRFNAVTLAHSQLWPRQIPEWILSSWDELKLELLDADEFWEIWTKWYEERLAGIPTSQEADIARVTIDENIWRHEPRVVNAHIRELIEEREIFKDALADDSEIPPAAEPSSGPGPQYLPRNGKLSEVVSLPSESEAAQQTNLHRVIRRDAATLAKAIESAANRYPELVRTVDEYSKLLNVKIVEADVAAIWSVGGVLASFAQAYRDQNAARTLSEPLEPQLDALLQSVVRQHGAFILGFEEGRDLVHRADEFALDVATLRELATPGTALLSELTDNRDLVDDRTREIHRPIRDRVIEIGWASSRVSYSAYLIVRNGVRAMIKYSVGEHPNAGAIIGLLTGASVLLNDQSAEFIRVAVPVLEQYGSQLLAFFNHSPEMRAYVEWALRILDTDHGRS